MNISECRNLPVLRTTILRRMMAKPIPTGDKYHSCRTVFACIDTVMSSTAGHLHRHVCTNKVICCCLDGPDTVFVELDGGGVSVESPFKGYALPALSCWV